MEVSTSNSKISGSFNATRLLALSTTNNAIEVSAQARNAEPGQPTLLSLKTTHPLDLRLTLTYPTKRSTREHLPYLRTDDNGPLALALSSPDDNTRPVLLHLDAATQNVLARVRGPFLSPHYALPS